MRDSSSLPRLQTEHQVIDETAEQPGFWPPGIIVSLPSLSAVHHFFVVSPASSPASREEREVRCTHTCIIPLRPARLRLWLSVSLSVFLFLFLIPPSSRVLLRLATLRRIHAVEGPSGTKTAAAAADIRYRLDSVSASFLLWISSSLTLSCSDLATLRKGTRGEDRERNEKEDTHTLIIVSELSACASLPPLRPSLSHASIL